MSDTRTCSTCGSYNNGFCKQWKTNISDTTMATDCSKYGVTAKLNKGMQIRKNKLDKKAKKRAEVKPEQKDLICFVEYSEKIIEKINGKYRRPTSSRKGTGLQIQNKIFLANGHHKMVNRSSLKITKRFDGIPNWATPKQIDMYNQSKTPNVEPVKKPARKRCNTCEHFIYAVNPATNKAGYRCEITGKFAKDYKQLEHCMAPQYKKKKVEK